MHERTASQLNHLIQNQEAMIEAYAYTISDVKDNELKSGLKTIQEKHFEQMMVFSDRVYEIGGNPKFKIGLSGVGEDMHHHREKRKDITDLEHIKIALERERKNTDKLSGFSMNDDPTSLELIQMAANRNRENIEALEAYIRHYEIQ